jgi:hypothetical protein
MLLYSNINTYEFLSYIGDMVFNATFNNISVISWWSVLLVEKTRAPGENGTQTAMYTYFGEPTHCVTTVHNRTRIVY